MKTEKLKNKHQARMNMRTMLISVNAVLGALVVIGLAYFALRGRDTLKFTDGIYKVINGVKIQYDAGVTLRHYDEGTVLTLGKNKENCEDRLLINPVERSITLQRSGSYNPTTDNTILRADYFTSVVEINGKPALKRGNKVNNNVSGVIYDNGDTYIFLEPATLVYGDVERKIPAMTVVEVSYLDYIQIYSLDKEPEFSYLSAESVMATFENGKRVNLATDRFYQKDGSWRLMYLPLDVLKSWK